MTMKKLDVRKEIHYIKLKRYYPMLAALSLSLMFLAGCGKL